MVLERFTTCNDLFFMRALSNSALFLFCLSLIPQRIKVLHWIVSDLLAILKSETKKATTVLDSCILCGQCSAVCPKKAIMMVGCGDGQVEKAEEFRLNPNDVLNTIRYRKSIRNFKKTEISKDIIQQILEAGRLTHTASNMQDVSFVVLDKEKKRIEKKAVRVFQTIKPIADPI